MSGRYVIPAAQRSALHKLERADVPVVLHTSVAASLQRRGLIEGGPEKWSLSDRGRQFIDAMNDPALTIQQLCSMYR